VFQRYTKALLGLTVAMILAAGGLVGEEKKWIDNAEYELFQAAAKEPDANKKLGLLKQHLDKYPQTAFKKENLILTLTAYQGLQQYPKVAETAKAILAIDPKDVTSMYWLTILTETLPPTPDSLATGEKAANGLLSAEKPETVQADQWAKMTQEFKVLGHKTLGFIGAQKKDYDTAEKEYKKTLEAQPNFGLVSYALGSSIIAQKKPERYSEALYHIGRSVALTGVGEVPAQSKTQFDNYLKKVYVQYHGSEEGLDQLKQLAKANPMPPADFKIKTKFEVEEEARQNLAKDNPSLAIWLNVKEQLKGPEGAKYFEDMFKGTAPPPFQATVISMEPENKPKKIIVGIEKPDVPEATLIMGEALGVKAEPGTKIKFTGVPASYQKEPFMVTFDVEDDSKIEGWPEAPKPVRRTPKKTAPKKK
jgi:tetratricopeptide (TPR) repeat protein